MAYDKSKEFRLLDHLDKLVDELRAVVGTALKGEDVEAVHDARVATRRLKAATELFGPVVSGKCRKPFDKITRFLRKRLGPLRDLDVMLGHLDEIKQESHRAAAQWLAGRMNEARQEVLKETSKAASHTRALSRLGGWWGLREEICQAREAAGSLLGQSVHLQVDEFAKSAEDMSKGDPHMLRIAGKSLRYTLEMARAHGNELPGSVMRQFKKMQESLGLWHDYVVLTERMLCEISQADLALHDAVLAGRVLALARVTLRKSQTHLKHMSDLWKKDGAEICQRIRGAFVLTRPSGAAGETKDTKPETESEGVPSGTAVSAGAGEELTGKSPADGDESHTTAFDLGRNVHAPSNGT